MSRRTLFLVLVIAAAVNSHELDASASSDAAERPRLSGRWRLDPEKSEDAEAKLREAMERRRPSGGMGGRPGGFGGGGFGGPDAGGPGSRTGGGRRGPGGAERMRDAMRPLFEPPDEMTIDDSDPQAIVMESDVVTRTLRPDGRKHEDADDVDVRTRWDKQRLVVETARKDHPRLTETFTVTPDPRQLEVEITIDGPFALSVRRVYVAAVD